MPSDLLTTEEREALRLTGKLANLGFQIIRQADGPTVEQDSQEWAIRIHSIQHMLMAQAAGRAYPQDFRLLGGTCAE